MAQAFDLGRWLSSDWSAVPVPVPYANLTNPQTLNLYSMVADDPESFGDLDGHDADGSDMASNSSSGNNSDTTTLATTATSPASAAAATTATQTPPPVAPVTPPQSQIDAVVERTLQISEAGAEKTGTFLVDAAGNLVGAFVFVVTGGVQKTATEDIDVARDPRDNGKTCSADKPPDPAPASGGSGKGAKEDYRPTQQR